MSEKHPDHSGETITIYKVDPTQRAGIVAVTCPSQQPDGRLDDRHSAYHDNISPPIEWTRVPDVRAWAVIVEDPDAPQEEPFIHWMIWNIPGDRISLPEGLPNSDFVPELGGAVQGRNGRHGYGWFGPRPPVGHGLHHYFIQVFALDDLLEMGPDTSLKELTNALKANTMASGEMAVTYEAPTAQ